MIVRRPTFQLMNIVPSGPGARSPADDSEVLPRHTHGSEGGILEGEQARALCRAKPAVADPLREVWG